MELPFAALRVCGFCAGDCLTRIFPPFDCFGVYAEQAEELETLVKQAHQLLSGEWEPDDTDRHKFLVRLERAIP